MKKLIVYHIKKLVKNGALGKYFPSSGRALIYIAAIIEHVKKFGGSISDMIELVQYHEEAHHLQYLAGIPFASKVIGCGSSFTEDNADDYALRKFFKVHGRKPNVVNWK